MNIFGKLISAFRLVQVEDYCGRIKADSVINIAPPPIFHLHNLEYLQLMTSKAPIFPAYFFKFYILVEVQFDHCALFILLPGLVSKDFYF